MGAWRDSIALGDPMDRREAAGGVDDLVVAAARGDLLARLSSGLVHEARNPLNAIAIHLEVLADKLGDPATGELPPQFARNIDAARGQVRRLDDLLRRYVEFAGRGSDPKTDDLAACLARAADLCAFDLRRGGLALEVDADPGVALVGADALCQAVLELLLLASRRAAPGSDLTLSGRAEDGNVLVALAGSGDDANPDESDRMAVDAIRAIAKALGGEFSLVAGERWCWSLRFSPSGVARSAVS